MLDRRQFITALGIASLSGTKVKAEAMKSNANPRFMPDESEPHQQTWMAFGASKRIWGRSLLPEVQQNLADIALTISQYEPVSMLVRESDLKLAERLMGSQVELIVCELDDLWMRDTGPVFVVNDDGDTQAIDFNFNGWGQKQEHRHDAKVAGFIAEYLGVPHTRSNLVLEGGGIEVDGRGTALITESCVLNNNRNPGITKAECEAELRAILGLDRIIWLPGIAGMEITDGHTDFYARFANPSTILAAYDPDPSSFDHAVTKKHLEILRNTTTLEGARYEVLVLEAPSKIRSRFDNDDFAAGYINFYVCIGAVIAPEFGDKTADAKAREKLQQVFPGRDIVQLNIDALAAGGGGIHCTTQQEPRPTA